MRKDLLGPSRHAGRHRAQAWLTAAAALPLALLAACGGSPGSAYPPVTAPTATPLDVIAQWFPGVTADGLIALLQGHGFTCDPPVLGGGRMSWLCSSSSSAGTTEETVSFLGNNPTQIALINATALAPASSAAVDFLGALAALPYTGAEPARAAQWVSDNITTGGALTIGSARFLLTAQSGGGTWILDILAEAPAP